MPNRASNHEDNQRLLSSAAHESFFHRRLLESLPAAAYTCDIQGFVTGFNQHAVNIWGRPLRLNHPADRFCASLKMLSVDGQPVDHANCWMAKALQEDHEFNGHEIIVEQPCGERISVLASASPVHSDTGQLLGSINIMVDISERKGFENELKDADRSKNAFLATLAHELRNPLAPLRNAAEILHLKAPPVPEMQWALEVIDRQMWQITRLVDDLLDIGRITSNKFTVRKSHVALSDVLNAAMEITQSCIRAADLQLHFFAPSESVFTHGDKARLTQVVVNLLHNSAKYTGQGGEIWLSLERAGNEAEIVVRDTGVGMSAEVLPRIFDMFTQADQTPEWSPGGLGIGLTLAKQVVEVHGGTISARSDGPGMGSTFVVRLPAIVEQDQPLPPKVDEPAVANVPSDLRILLADDDRDVTDSLVMLLEIMGSKIRTARDGYEAMDVAESYRPDVMLVDIGMPKLNGYDTARAIRQQPWGRDVVLVAFTGWGQDADRQRAREAGFDHHLTKPVDLQALVRLLSSLEPHRSA